MQKEKMYQILVVARGVGFNFIIPDKYIYTNIEDALKDIEKRTLAFEADGEELNYKGFVSNLGHISKIYNNHDMAQNTNDAYIYEIQVK